MEEQRPDFEARGASLVAIGQGAGGDAARFCARLGAGFPCLGDPKRAAYKAFGVPRGSMADVTLKPFLRNPLDGIRQTFRADLKAGAAPASDVRQLGGVAIVDRAGRTRYVYKQELSSDLPAVSELLDVLDALNAEVNA